MSIDYAARCASAASAQGLDPLTDALKVAGIEYDVEQTGGMCMAVTVRNPSGVVAATHDSFRHDQGFVTAFYPGDTWTEGGEPVDERTTDLYAAIRRLEHHATAEHTDLRQEYVGGHFVTVCSCGDRFPGPTPDDADAAWSAHADGDTDLANRLA